jgi:hypothetical protein
MIKREKQVSVFVENRPGRLVATLEVLERRKISIRGMALGDAAEIGIVRLILTKPEEALEEFKKAGFVARIDAVVCAEMPDVPGGLLNNVARPLANAGINLHYFYGYTEPSTGKTTIALKTDDLDKTESVLKSAKG